MQGVKNIIFDLGGVILSIDYNKTAEAFKQLGVTHFDELYNQHKASPLFEDLETGRISEEEFFTEFTQLCGTELKKEDITKAWNAMLGYFPKERIELLKELKQRYNLFLFSNTNKIHFDAFQKLFREQIGGNFDDFFVKAYYSHTMQQRKPNKDAFEFILKEQNLKPEETLFIDDTEGNIQPAKDLGIQTVHLKPPTTILDLGL
jgi:epoxide hydrolase-like predicted phosphatase